MNVQSLTPAKAYELYKAAYNEDRLTQNAWHREEDGRQLTCALGVLGDDVNGPRDCPANVMPRWLARMVPWFFDNQDFDDAKAWGLEFYAQLKRLNGEVPFSVVHDWQAHVVGPLAIEVAEDRGGKPDVHRALAEMQFKALRGHKFTADEWKPVLRATFSDAYAYANADAYANAYADADADAYARADATYDANTYAYANANAYADADADAYRTSIKRLAFGMVECLKRVEV